MFNWLQSLDVSLFRFVNQTLSNPIFDKVMPFFGDTPGFGFAVFAILLYLFIKGGAKGRIFAFVLLMGVGFCDGAVCNTLKHAVGRLRPFNDILDANVLMGRGMSFSMPSSHAGNWFAATIISFLFYRKSLRFMLPLAIAVSFSRVYTGVHYPSDVLAGALLGAGTGVAIVWALNGLWQVVGAQWFPVWHSQQPSLFVSKPRPDAPCPQAEWLRLGYLIIGILFLVRIGYLAAGRIELTEDEAYQWCWSRHLDLSYYSKPPMIAYIQFLGTYLWGNTMFGVRFFSPVITAILSVLVLRFMAREYNARAAVTLLAILSSVLLTAAGGVLMTIDPLSVLFWMAALIAGWRACQEEGTTGQWLWVGLWMGLGFLSKYTNLFQWLCWAVFFALWPPARKHLRRPGPYLALLINAVCALPVLIWNAHHGWVTVQHVANDGGRLDKPWEYKRIATYIGEFFGSEFGLLNPVFFVGMIWAAVAFWRGRKKAAASGQAQYPFQLFLFSMGAPLFLFYSLLTLHSRVLQNWIVPSVVPLFCLMILYFGDRWDVLGKKLKPWLGIGIGLGLFLVIVSHETDLLAKMVCRPLPAGMDVLRRARGWEEAAAEVGKLQAKLEAEEGKPVFIIGDHYGTTGLLSFYMPEAKERAQTGSEALVFFRHTTNAVNQFYFWPSYTNRVGQNAIFVRKIGMPPFTDDWKKRWWDKRLDYYKTDTITNGVFVSGVEDQFESVKYLGVKDIFYKGRLMQRIQLFECKNLLKSS